MRLPLLAAGFGLLLLPAPAAPADVTVHFVSPERYTDTGGYGSDTARKLRALAGHLERLSARCLAAGETLEYRVHDVDLAGHDEWWHRGAYDVRVMRDITWPRIDLSFERRDSAGKIVAEGREKVSDMSYLWRSAWVRNDADALPYEKAMLKEWIEQRFCRDPAPRPARSY